MTSNLTLICEALSFISIGAERVIKGYPVVLTTILCIITGVLLLVGK